jgi:hypothetical protein
MHYTLSSYACLFVFFFYLIPFGFLDLAEVYEGADQELEMQKA